ncbi:uncharacterized protein SCHCODRAFT_0238763 [Schizophyllum commune H4-8]|uniref:uncharacterized protein n=1 Tax=Schizophyllum commune (strain H4-8 / FGSC 9210) TaxID=578458 RepID=UPI0021608522|nr:uncharacterized protein SCHCODRAFT_0238763 [Schizophyllum commune H4-8]KAI5884978.1 hypothetical protein SCHCODRAFT_0238763 [Schizophyllum commune H4-8]
MSSEREYLYTFDENDDDPTLMVITPPLCTQSPEGHIDAYGRTYAKFPSFFGLCYAVSTNHIVDMCKRTGDGYYGDRCFTIIKFFERLEAATGVNRDNGIHRVELPSGYIAYLLVISCSDQLETLPHPKNRIQKFKQVLHTNRDPIPRKLGQPRMPCKHAQLPVMEIQCPVVPHWIWSLERVARARGTKLRGSGGSHERALFPTLISPVAPREMASLSTVPTSSAGKGTFTFDENEDPRLMVITPPMYNQTPVPHTDSHGQTYFQLPPYYGLSYVVTTNNIYNICKRTGDGFYGDRCFTIMQFFERLEAATGIYRDHGLHPYELPDGRTAYILLISSSDKPDTVPRPAARIQRFKRILHTKQEPVVRSFTQPKNSLSELSLSSPILHEFFFSKTLCIMRAKLQSDRLSLLIVHIAEFTSTVKQRCLRETWTLNENDDVRRTVITKGMIGQRRNLHQDSFGRHYWQFPDYHSLSYVTSTTNIYHECKKRRVDHNGQRIFYGDRCLTVYKWLERLEAELGVTEGNGLYKTELDDGRLVYVLVVAASEKPETVPRPAARIEAFKKFLNTKKEPRGRRMIQPRGVNLWPFAPVAFGSAMGAHHFPRPYLVPNLYIARHIDMSSARAPTCTLDEDDEDITLMVITQPLCKQTPEVHRDSDGAPYTQMPSFFGLCYATTTNNIYNMCKRTGDGFYRDRCFTLIKFFDRLEEALGLSLDNGIHRVELPSGLIAYVLVVSCSDKAETLPRPAARIRKFKALLHTEREPVPRQLVQPRMRRLSSLQILRTHSPVFRCTRNSMERASTWTCDENDEDVRRMIITPGMISQKANIHRDSLGRPYSQLSDYHGLCYAITPSNIYNMCKARPKDREGNKCFYGDRCFTIYKWFERLEEATGIFRGKGLYECALDDGQPMMILVISCSDKPDTIPRPAARIKAFKDFLGTKREPMVKRFVQPRNMDTFSSSPASHEHQSTWTCNDDDPDIRRMVITCGMINQKAEAHRDSLGRHYCQLPSHYGLCYGITPSNIYNMCKAIPMDRDGKQCFYGDRNGLHECQLKNGQPAMLMIIACSNKPETVPRPAARIEAFKTFLCIERDPVVRRLNQPKMYGL